MHVVGHLAAAMIHALALDAGAHRGAVLTDAGSPERHPEETDVGVLRDVVDVGRVDADTRVLGVAEGGGDSAHAVDVPLDELPPGHESRNR